MLVYEQFAVGSVRRYFQSEGPQSEDPRSIDIASILSNAGTKDVTMPLNSGMNYVHEVLPANRLL